ncbi:MAG: hypothetical protein J5747_00505 [Spirochaetaceae bacterium]|nr:hypothetical protein [Spirochaetaceae bacterium]
MAFQRTVELSVTTKDGENKKIDNLRIDFEIERSDTAENNRAVVRIYNLTKETSAQVTEADGHILLRAGYKDESIGTIFSGDILRGCRIREGNDYITTIEAYDGRTAVMGGLVSLSYAPDTDALTIAQALLDAIGLANKGTDLISGGEKYPHGYCFVGLATDGLSELLSRFGLSFMVQDETVYIFEPGKETENSDLTLEDGGALLSLPQPVSDKTEIKDIDEESKNIWAFSAKLNPQLVPGALVSIDSSTFKGDVVIRSARCTGSNMDGDFRVDIEAEAA